MANARGRARACRWNNIWPFAAVDFHQVIQLCCAVRACLRSSRYTCSRVALAPLRACSLPAVYYPNFIIALCLRGYNVSRCICHGATRLASPHLPSPRAQSVKWLNCFVHAITKLLTIYNQPAGTLSCARFLAPINFMNTRDPRACTYTCSSFFGCRINQRRSVRAINVY